MYLVFTRDENMFLLCNCKWIIFLINFFIIKGAFNDSLSTKHLMFIYICTIHTFENAILTYDLVNTILTISFMTHRSKFSMMHWPKNSSCVWIKVICTFDLVGMILIISFSNTQDKTFNKKNIFLILQLFMIFVISLSTKCWLVLIPKLIFRFIFVPIVKFLC